MCLFTFIQKILTNTVYCVEIIIILCFKIFHREFKIEILQLFKLNERIISKTKYTKFMNHKKKISHIIIY